MRGRWTWVAWSMLAVYVVSLALAAILAAANRTLDPVSFAELGLGFGAFMVVGALIVAHRPTNAIGWMFSATADHKDRSRDVVVVVVAVYSCYDPTSSYLARMLKRRHEPSDSP